MCRDLGTWLLACVFELGDGEWGRRLTVPSSLHMALDPLFYRRDILLGVFEIFSDVGCLAARDEAVLGWFARLGVNGPATVLDAC